MRKIGSLVLAVALLVSTGAVFAESAPAPTASTSDGSVMVPAEKETNRLSKGFINRAERMCQELQVEHSLAWIPKTLCFYLLNQEDQAKSEKIKARAE